jgi:hypothetical protein
MNFNMDSFEQIGSPTGVVLPAARHHVTVFVVVPATYTSLPDTKIEHVSAESASYGSTLSPFFQ